MVSITLRGRVPSKKNAWRRKEGQKAYLPAQIKADIEALEWEAISERNKVPAADLAALRNAKRIRVVGEFHVRKEIVDLDNAWTTLLDVLQKSGIITNDKLVRSAAYDEIVDPNCEEHVCVNLFAL